MNLSTKRLYARDKALYFLEELVINHPGLVTDDPVNAADFIGDFNSMPKALREYLEAFHNDESEVD